MVRKKNLFVFILLFIISISLFSQQGVEEKVNRYIDWMENKKVSLWKAVKKLEEIGTDAVPIIKEKLPSLNEHTRVGCSKALIELREEAYGMNQLLKVIETGKDLKARMDAIYLIGIFGNYLYFEKLDEKLLSTMEKTFQPYLKIALAKTVWQISRNPQAVRVLKSFLKSDSQELQYEAALALGEIQNVESAKTVLSKLQHEPTARGRLARSLLEQHTIINRYERLLDSTRVTGPKLKYPLVDEVIKKIQEYHVEGDKYKKKDLIYAAVKGMVASTDMHSAFWTPEEWKAFVKATIKEEYVGIGVYVGMRDGYFTVIAPIYSGPAYRAGLRSMDRILEVDGWSTSGKPIDEIIKRVKGEKDTKVKLKVYRKGWAKVREIPVERKSIKIPSLFYQMLPGKIGYLKLIQFSRRSSDDMEEALKDMAKKGMKGFILDLRGNAGGWLKTAIDVVDKFLAPGKLVVYSKGRHPIKGHKYEYYTTFEGRTDFPMSILVDGSSASASEIVAGVLQYYKRAVLVGTRTFGKGSVQEPIAIDSEIGARIKLTIAKYYLPDDRCIHNTYKDHQLVKHNGVAPDVEVKYEKWEPWKNEERARLEEENLFKKYIDKYYKSNKDLFLKLADNDDLEYKKYPGFEEWYKSLSTKASKQDVRFWLRIHLRRLASDEKGREYACDYLEDVMLQKAIEVVLKKLKAKLSDIKEYKILDKEEKK